MPRYGDSRIIRRFLLWPRTIAAERRWLEWAKIEQKYESYAHALFGTRFDYRWFDYKWVDVAWGN